MTAISSWLYGTVFSSDQQPLGMHHTLKRGGFAQVSEYWTSLGLRLVFEAIVVEDMREYMAAAVGALFFWKVQLCKWSAGTGTPVQSV